MAITSATSFRQRDPEMTLIYSFLLEAARFVSVFRLRRKAHPSVRIPRGSSCVPLLVAQQHIPRLGDDADPRYPQIAYLLGTLRNRPRCDGRDVNSSS